MRNLAAPARVGVAGCGRPPGRGLCSGRCPRDQRGDGHDGSRRDDHDRSHSRPPRRTTTATTTTATTLPPVTTSTIPPTTTTTLPAWWREATPEEPLRVWVIGDSLAGPTGSALCRAGQGHGGGGHGARLPERHRPCQPRRSSTGRGSSRGAWPPLPRTWWCAARGQRRPGDGLPGRLAGVRHGGVGRALLRPWQAGSWTCCWSARARVYWVGVPIMADPNYDARIRHINADPAGAGGAAPRRALRRRLPPASRGRTGSTPRTCPTRTATSVTVRAPDGIHFTPAGAQRMARRLMEILSAEWRLTGSRAAEDRPQQLVGRRPDGSGGVQPRRHDGGGCGGGRRPPCADGGSPRPRPAPPRRARWRG